MNGNFDARLRRLEILNPAVKREEWRAYLASCFAGERYEGHRAAIIEALTSDTPVYDFDRLGIHHHIEWWNRGTPGAGPLILTTRTQTWDAV